MERMRRGRVPGRDREVGGLATAVLFLAFFGAMWAWLGLGGLKRLDSPWLTLGVLIPGILLLIGGISLRVEWRASRPESTPARKAPGPSKAGRFRLVFGTEVAFIILAYVVCRAANRVELFIPAMMLIVGVHFLPLASLLGVQRYYATGGLLCALVIATLLVVPERVTLAGARIAAWSVVLGLGGAAILWIVGMMQWKDAKKVLDVRGDRAG